MVERESQREREAEAQHPGFYEWVVNVWNKWEERAIEGRLVQKWDQVPWEQGRQGRIKYLVHPLREDLALGNWLVFVQDIRSHSGKHRHQGGLAIYVVEGKGWTTVNGVRHDWEEGDLILLPVLPGGVEHQHFNAQPGTPCKWLAMIYQPLIECMASRIEQKEPSPDFGHA